MVVKDSDATRDVREEKKGKVQRADSLHCETIQCTLWWQLGDIAVTALS